MNIFVTDYCPVQSARNLPDKHICKMPLETCQMLAIIYSDWYYGVGKLYKAPTAHHIAQPTVHFASIRVLCGLLPTSTTLRGSYYTALHCVTSTINATYPKYTLVTTYYAKHSVSTTTVSTSHSRTLPLWYHILHVPCQTTSSTIPQSLPYRHTNSISTPSRGCLPTTYAYHHASHHSLCDA